MAEQRFKKIQFGIKNLTSLLIYLFFIFIWVFAPSLKAGEEGFNPFRGDCVFRSGEFFCGEEWHPFSFGEQWCNLSYTLDLKVFYDPDKSPEELKENYKRFAFDYTSKQNPLLEKELFKILERELTAKGMIRDEKNPDLLITMNYYIGKRENYIPPQTITISKTNYVWTTGMIGWTPTGQMQPVTETETKTIPGKTEITYYRNIRLNFLDYKLLKGGEKPELPPLVWIGEVESEGSTNDLRGVAPVLLRELLREYPEKSELTKNRTMKIDCRTYGDLGVRTLKNDWLKIKRVIPDSPAEKAGLKPEDQILKINGKYQDKGYYACMEFQKSAHPFGYSNPYKLEQYKRECFNSDPFYTQVIRNTQGKEVKLTIRSPGEKKPREITLTPEVKNICFYYQPGKTGFFVSPKWVKDMLYYIKK